MQSTSCLCLWAFVLLARAHADELSDESRVESDEPQVEPPAAAKGTAGVDAPTLSKADSDKPQAANGADDDLSPQEATEAATWLLNEYHPGGLPPPGKDADVHALYYLWFGDNSTAVGWGEWEAVTLAHHSRRSLRDAHPHGALHSAPETIAAPFYPAKGCYSSSDPFVVAAHLREMQSAGVGVAIASIAGRPGGTARLSGERGPAQDKALQVLFAQAEEVGVKVAFHIEAYPERSALSLLADVQYLVGNFGDSPALFRDAARGNRPWVYVHDSYRIPAEALGALFGRADADMSGSLSVRGTAADVVAIGMYYTDPGTRQHLLRAGFDGVYTMFASDGVTEGSSLAKWAGIRAWTRASGLLFVPSTAPGYDDLKRKPWNKRARRQRGGGEYYRRMWQAAIAAEADAVSVTSFNDWTEGSQIEPSRPAEAAADQPDGGDAYQSYSPQSPEFYLELTRELADAFRQEKLERRGASHDEL